LKRATGVSFGTLPANSQIVQVFANVLEEFDFNDTSANEGIYVESNIGVAGSPEVEILSRGKIPIKKGPVRLDDVAEVRGFANTPYQRATILTAKLDTRAPSPKGSLIIAIGFVTI
jgi:hypothetical protein